MGNATAAGATPTMSQALQSGEREGPAKREGEGQQAMDGRRFSRHRSYPRSCEMSRLVKSGRNVVAVMLTTAQKAI